MITQMTSLKIMPPQANKITEIGTPLPSILNNQTKTISVYKPAIYPSPKLNLPNVKST